MSVRASSFLQSIRLLSIVIFCLVCRDAGAKATESPVGQWIGRLDIASQPSVLQIAVEPAGNGWTANVSLLPSTTFRDVRIAINETGWSFVAGVAPNLLQVDVRTIGNISRANVSFRNQAAQISLRRLASVDNSQYRRYAGTYVLPSGKRIYIRPSNTSGQILTYLEEATGGSGILYPLAIDSYIGGPSFYLPEPIRVRATFRGSDGTKGLLWQESGGKQTVAVKRKAYRREDITLDGPGGVLGCEFLTPVTADKHPAFVLVSGAGANDRYIWSNIMAEAFADHGVAALACDKRGTGTSAGNWSSTSFEEQAHDVIAQAHYLQRRGEIDSNRVGVWAFSEGAWVAPIAVAEDPSLAFLAMVAVPATSRRASILIASSERLRANGTSEKEVARYREFFERYQQVIMDKDAAAIERLRQEYSGAPWLPNNMANAQNLDDRLWQRQRLTWPYEPAPVLSRITKPVLAIWGQEDDEFPPRINLPLFEEMMLTARNPDYTLRVVPNSDHGLWIVARSSVEQTGYSPEYLRLVSEWIRTRLTPIRHD